MQPTESKQPQGSFVSADKIRQDMDARARARAQTPPAGAKPVPERPLSEEEIQARVEEAEKAVKAAESAPPKEKTQADLDKERLLEIKINLEKRLEMKFSEDDLSEYLLKGSVRKEITIIPGMLKGVFRTLSTAEFQDIDEVMREKTAEAKQTSSGLENERTILTLAKVWIGIQQKKPSEAWTGTPRMFAKEESDREQSIRKMGAMTIQYASEAWVNYNTVLKIAFEEEQLLKKS